MLRTSQQLIQTGVEYASTAPVGGLQIKYYFRVVITPTNSSTRSIIDRGQLQKYSYTDFVLFTAYSPTKTR